MANKKLTDLAFFDQAWTCPGELGVLFLAVIVQKIVVEV
jgi:hypothetical protein